MPTISRPTIDADACPSRQALTVCPKSLMTPPFTARSMVTGITMSPKLEYAGSFAIWAAAASPISRLPQPTLQYQRDAVASR